MNIVGRRINRVVRCVGRRIKELGEEWIEFEEGWIIKLSLPFSPNTKRKKKAPPPLPGNQLIF